MNKDCSHKFVGPNACAHCGATMEQVKAAGYDEALRLLHEQSAEVARLREEANSFICNACQVLRDALATERAAHELEKRERERNWNERNEARARAEAAERRVAELERERDAAFRKGFEACELGEPLSPNRLKERTLDRLEMDLAEANATIDRETEATIHWLRRAQKAEALIADKELVLERYAQLKDNIASARRLLGRIADCWAENEEAEAVLRDVETWLRAHPEPATPAVKPHPPSIYDVPEDRAILAAIHRATVPQRATGAERVYVPGPRFCACGRVEKERET